MPIQSIWMIRASLIYFLAVFIIGGFMLVHKGIFLHSFAWSLLQVHIELALFGWLIQFVLGTAYWMLPRFLEGPKRGSKGMAWLMILLLNSGIWIYLLSYFGMISQTGFLIGRALELAAVGCFVYLHWNRIVRYRRGH